MGTGHAYLTGSHVVSARARICDTPPRGFLVGCSSCEEESSKSSSRQTEQQHTDGAAADRRRSW